MRTTLEPSRSPHSKLLDVSRIRQDFPALHQQVRGKPLVYLDNAASSQKPQAVIDAVVRNYAQDASNVHRGLHALSERATEAYEGARQRIASFINSSSSREIIFVRGATEAINLVAQTYGRQQVGPGDEVLVTAMEHHSNIVPWQMLCEEKGTRLQVAPMDERGDVRLEEYERLLSERTRLVAMTYVSNALGTVNPVHQMIEMAHERGAVTVVDGAQAVQHLPVDVGQLGCDFFAFSGHKAYGPTGIGVLHGRSELLEAMPPYQGGGDMIRSVSFEKTEFNDLPHKFEAGTPHIAGAIGLGAALDYLDNVGLEAICAYEEVLLRKATERIGAVAGVRLIGTAARRASVTSFVVEGVHPHDVGTILDQEGIAVRAGHHCAQPVMQHFGVPATVRASLALYNTEEELDVLVTGLEKVVKIFS